MSKKIILLDSIRSMNNVGAIFRTCDGAGFDKILLTGHTPYPPRKDISKTAIWAENYIDWEYWQNPINIIKQLKKEGFVIISVELGESSLHYDKLEEYRDIDVCLVVGNEIEWVKKEIISLSDETVYIPMNGKKDSLNVAVASGIVIYKLIK